MSKKDFSTIDIQKDKHVWRVKLNRPDVRNAFNTLMIEELTSIFKTINEQKNLRLVILEGEGKAFCAGADLAWMKSMVNFSLEENRKDAGMLFDMFQTIHSCSVPIIGNVHGAVFGGALGLIACCDIVVAEEKTQFCFSEVKLGIVPAVISGFVLDKGIRSKVTPHMIWGDVFTTEQACDSGLVNVSVKTKAEAEKYIAGKINEIKQAGPEAVRETKKLLRKIHQAPWDSKRTLSTEVISDRRVSSEGQEGLLSFLEKREPSWRDDDGSN